MKGRAWKTFVTIVMVLIGISFLGMGFALQRNTLVEWWTPALICLVPSLPVGLVLSRLFDKITVLDSRLISILSAVVFSFCVFFGGFYILNYYCSREDSSQKYETEVVRKFTKERYRVKRLSRNRIRKGEKYTVHFIVVSLPGGKEKKMEVTYAQYSRIRKSQSLTLDVEKGLFSVPVIKNMDFPVRQYKSERPENPYIKYRNSK